jgi:hypothetical protein
VAVAAAGTLVRWVNEIRPGLGPPASIARLLGLVGLTGATVFGLFRAVSDAVEIIT